MMENIFKVALLLSIFCNVYLIASANSRVFELENSYESRDVDRVRDIQFLSSLIVNKFNKEEVLGLLKTNFPEAKISFKQGENSIWTNDIGTLRVYFDKESRLNRIWIDPYTINEK